MVPVDEVAGAEIAQVVIGSSANPGIRDFAIAAMIVAGRQSDDRVSFDVNPTSRQTLEALTREGHLFDLIAAGARVHQSGCMGCIGMGQAPATDTISLRTMPRNFPGRSGTKEDRVYLCSPETAAASALTGVITDPRTLDMAYPRYTPPAETFVNTDMLVAPDPDARVVLLKGPNIASFPDFDPLPDSLECPVLLQMGDDISTDEISPAGARVLPYRSNLPKLAEFSFDPVDPTYPTRAAEVQGPHAVVAGDNYGQGSSREHAALAPRSLGLRVVLAAGFARIHWQNLANYGVLPLEFVDPSDRERLTVGTVLHLPDVRAELRAGTPITVETDGGAVAVRHRLSDRQVTAVLEGGVINAVKARLDG